MKTIVSKSVQDTARVAQGIARRVRGGEVFALQGELGTGKTAFVKAFGKALGIRQIISSPTFLVMRVYSVQGSAFRGQYLVHVDAYRVRDAQELLDIGLGDYLGRPDTIVFIEWAEKAKGILLRRKVQWIRFDFGKEEHERILTVS